VTGVRSPGRSRNFRVLNTTINNPYPLRTGSAHLACGKKEPGHEHMARACPTPMTGQVTEQEHYWQVVYATHMMCQRVAERAQKGQAQIGMVEDGRGWSQGNNQELSA
jgi:hypothetical protein